ncbi:MAG: hypothetical protein LBF60_02165, partial [Treponema sp.]|nr:hypothetical protein [Treponema sp.]
AHKNLQKSPEKAIFYLANRQAETAKKTKFSRGPFIGVFMVFFNEKTIKIYKRNRPPGVPGDGTRVCL